MTATGSTAACKRDGHLALLNNPLVGSYPAAVELVDRLVEAHRAYLPAFAH
jgi:alpha-galactosidase/6-phospho-beta-glucosidase family protein